MVSFLIQFQNILLFNTFFKRMQEGGFLTTTLSVLLLVISVIIFIKGILQIKKGIKVGYKNIKLINALGLLALVQGVFGQLIGMVSVLDKFEFVGADSAVLLASGLKLSFLPTLFGTFTFIISKVASIILLAIQKESKVDS